MDDWDGATWDQAEQDERHRREDEALERARRITDEFKRTNAKFEADTNAFNERIQRTRII